MHFRVKTLLLEKREDFAPALFPDGDNQRGGGTHIVIRTCAKIRLKPAILLKQFR